VAEVSSCYKLVNDLVGVMKHERADITQRGEVVEQKTIGP
jgi:hypothetical protein